MTPLGREIARIIALEGPINIARYMGLCLGHPRHGYYMSRDPFGAGGDFTTAPEISQMFGELIGLWAASVWLSMGEPEKLALVELGPGRGTLMADALRAARIVPGFSAAVSIHLVETSPILRERQKSTLAAHAGAITWHDRFETVPEGPLIVVANEFFDALPVRQFVRGETGWFERAVGLDAEGKFRFGLFAQAEPSLRADAPAGAVLEIAEASAAIMEAIAKRIAAWGGAALAIDYGHERTGLGDTLQAVRRHAFTDPLAEPGEADLTVHVDFAALARTAARAGVAVDGPVTQGAFLRELGIEARAERLKAKASPEQKGAIDAALARLAGEGADAMGRLFKAMAVRHPSLPPTPGFAAA